MAESPADPAFVTQVQEPLRQGAAVDSTRAKRDMPAANYRFPPRKDSLHAIRVSNSLAASGDLATLLRSRLEGLLSEGLSCEGEDTCFSSKMSCSRSYM